jgi:hypothetical protein
MCVRTAVRVRAVQARESAHDAVALDLRFRSWADLPAGLMAVVAVVMIVLSVVHNVVQHRPDPG